MQYLKNYVCKAKDGADWCFIKFKDLKNIINSPLLEIFAPLKLMVPGLDGNLLQSDCLSLQKIVGILKWWERFLTKGN